MKKLNADDKLSEWIDSLDEEKKDEILFQLINRLIEAEDIRYVPQEGENKAPYWEANGDDIDDFELE